MKDSILLQDSDGNHYDIPLELEEEFKFDSKDEDFIDCGYFNDRYNKYRVLSIDDEYFED